MCGGGGGGGVVVVVGGTQTEGDGGGLGRIVDESLHKTRHRYVGEGVVGCQEQDTGPL